MKVSKKLAHEIQNRLQVIVGHLELALDAEIENGAKKNIRKAKAATLELARIVTAQTVGKVDNCEECGAFIIRTTLESETRKK